MKVGLVDIDSKIPNLALMKLSSFYKEKGSMVNLISPGMARYYDVVFASQVFDFTTTPEFPSNTEVGGSGVGLNLNLDECIEKLSPDYALYPCEYALGFTSRGCSRNCPYCIVPEKEGKFHVVGDIYDFWCGQKQIMLLDNSINTDEDHFIGICTQLIKEKIRVDFSQGLDIRFLTEKQVYFLSKLKMWKQIRFAWDLVGIEDAVRRGVELLKRYKLRSKSMFYVLIGYTSTPEEDLYRVNVLKELGVDSFVMPYNKFNEYQRDFTRWVNHKAIFNTVSWKDYLTGIDYRRM